MEKNQQPHKKARMTATNVAEESNTLVTETTIVTTATATTLHTATTSHDANQRIITFVVDLSQKRYNSIHELWSSNDNGNNTSEDQANRGEEVDDEDEGNGGGGGGAAAATADAASKRAQARAMDKLELQSDIRNINEQISKIEDKSRIEITLNGTRNFFTELGPKDFEYIFQFSGASVYITKLMFNKNELTAIPPVGSLVNLRSLSLAYNKITAFNEELKPLKKLKELDLRGNNIAKIEHLEENTGLEWLSLSGNSLTSIDGLPPLPHLVYLGLFGNQLGAEAEGSQEEGAQQLLDALKRNPLSQSLERLYLSANPVLSKIFLDYYHVYGGGCSKTDPELEARYAKFISFRSQLILALPRLKWLDEYYIAHKERTKLAAAATATATAPVPAPAQQQQQLQQLQLQLQ